MKFIEFLQIVSKILGIVLLAFFVLIAYNSYLTVKELRETIHTRLENDQFPLPTGGLTLPGDSAQSSSSQGVIEFDTSKIKDATLRSTIEKALAGFNNEDTAEGLRQLGILDVQLGERKLSAAQAKNQELITAINNNQDEIAKKAMYELIESLRVF